MGQAKPKLIQLQRIITIFSIKVLESYQKQ